MIMHRKVRLDRKLFGSYIIIILITITTSFTLFTLTANQFFIYRIEQTMEAQMAVAKENILTHGSPNQAATEALNESLMKMVHVDLILLVDGMPTVYTNLYIFDDIRTNADNLSYLETKYIITLEEFEFEGRKYSLFLISEKDMIATLNQINLSILFVTSLVSMLIAAFFGVYAQNNISKPIRELEDKVKDFRESMTAPLVTIFTHDEIQDLDENIVQMAEDIVNNDRKRKAFFENTSHELKTPLMNIRGYAEGLKDGVFTVDEAADVILTESESLRTMVEAILYLSKLEDSTHDRYQFNPIDMNEFLHGFYHKMAGVVADGNLQLILDLSESVEVEIDDDKMIRALSNVITNAVRYAENKIVIKTTIEGDMLNIRMFNDGPHVEEDVLPRIFDRFYKGDKGQSGLGLTIVQTIISAHGGTIEALNIDEGFCMNIHLPYNKI